MNDTLSCFQWVKTRAWRWARARHINVLESDSVVQLYKDLVLQGGDCRFLAITDSSVVLGAHQKGRTSAKLLAPSIRRGAATLLAGGLYPAQLYSPTRLNPSDDPTRVVEVRRPQGSRLSDFLPLWDLAGLVNLSRPRANWVRLFLLVGSPCLERALARLQALRDFPFGSRYLQSLLLLITLLWTLTRPSASQEKGLLSSSSSSAFSVQASLLCYLLRLPMPCFSQETPLTVPDSSKESLDFLLGALCSPGLGLIGVGYLRPFRNGWRKSLGFRSPFWLSENPSTLRSFVTG